MGTLSFPLTGVASDYRVPAVLGELLFAQGPSTASAGQRAVLFVGPKTSAGTYTANTVVRVTNAAAAEAGAGAGSPLHRAIRAFLLKNNTAECWALPYAETASGSPVAAAGTITVTAASITAAGAIEVDVCGEQMVMSYSTSDTATTIGDKIVAAVNAKTWLPVTAANNTGTVTLTAKVKGTSQGTASVGVIRYRATVLSGTGPTLATSGAALGLGTGTPGAEGSTTEVANLTTALATVQAARYYYVIFTDSVAAACDAVLTHVTLKALPKNGLRQVAITGYTGSLATAITLATGRNHERLAIAWQPNSEHDTAELAGYLGAVRHLGESSRLSWNFDGYRGPLWGVQAAYAQSDWPTVDDQNDAINGGLTPIASDSRGSYIVMSCNTRSKNSTGTVNDFRATETHRVSIADGFLDTGIARSAANFAGKSLRDDERLANGNVNPNQLVPVNVVVPSRVIPTWNQLINEFYDLGYLQEIDATKAGLQLIKSSTNSGRTEAQLDIRTIDLLHQMTFRVAEVSPG